MTSETFHLELTSIWGKSVFNRRRAAYGVLFALAIFCMILGSSKDADNVVEKAALGFISQAGGVVFAILITYIIYDQFIMAEFLRRLSKEIKASTRPTYRLIQLGLVDAATVREDKVLCDRVRAARRRVWIRQSWLDGYKELAKAVEDRLREVPELDVRIVLAAPQSSFLADRIRGGEIDNPGLNCTDEASNCRNRFAEMFRESKKPVFRRLLLYSRTIYYPAYIFDDEALIGFYPHNGSSQHRHNFVVRARGSNGLFEMFCNDFETMWKDGLETCEQMPS